MLKFLGIGSAFNTELGNNSAFIKEGKSLLLIDCGGTVFHDLQKYHLLEGLEEIFVLITHTHPDHVGSLGEVIFYCYYILKVKVNLFFPNEILMISYLQIIGVTPDMYCLQTAEDIQFSVNELELTSLQWIEQEHVETMPAYSFIVKGQGVSFYYSGDGYALRDNVIKRLVKGEIKYIYQDTCGLDYENNAHLYLHKLADLIPQNLREYVYCMHLDKHIKLAEIQQLGFNVVERISSNFWG
ncbi:MBL fold metallo-hydrolase [Niameybacter sp.]|uniref:MBL fold metallo-hydrolase n=1 Tax=Niameybacter sp. TaxID=2033640 RepID=UPI002FC761BA